MIPFPVLKTEAFWFSLALVIFWAFWDFHYPRHPSTIRYATAPRRYRLGVGLYLAAAVTTYLLVMRFFELAMYFIEVKLTRLHPPVEVALVTALLVTILLPKLPYTRDVLNLVRAMTQRLSLFPDAARRLTVALSSQRLSPKPSSTLVLRREIARYGIDEVAIERNLSQSAVSRLDEAQTLRDQFEAVMTEPVQRGFSAARSGDIDAARQEHRRLLQRAARAILLADTVGEVAGIRIRPGDDNDEDDEDSYGSDTGENAIPNLGKVILSAELVSQFVAEESEASALRYRRLVAEATLSSIGNVTDRAKLLERFGYEPPPERDLPFWAIVAVLAVFPTTLFLFIIPLLVSRFVSLPAWFFITPNGEIDPVSVMSVGIIFAAARMTSVFWAVLPKLATRFARPSLSALPTLSYVVCGFFAGLTDLLVRVQLFLGADRPSNLPAFHFSLPAMLLITSMFPIVITVGLSILIDLRLRDRLYQFTKGRVNDGLWLGAGMAVTDVVVQATLRGLGGFSPGVFLTLVLGATGFVIGYLVPPSVPAYLNENEAEWARVWGDTDNNELGEDTAAPSSRLTGRQPVTHKSVSMATRMKIP